MHPGIIPTSAPSTRRFYSRALCLKAFRNLPKGRLPPKRGKRHLPVSPEKEEVHGLKKSLRLLCSTIPALTLLTGAVLKAWDFDGFLEKALYYRALDLFWIQVSALSTIFVEWILGILLLFRIWLRPFTLPATITLLLFFSALIAWAWHKYGLEDCGCFGSFVETPPWLSLVKNGILLAMSGALYFMEGSTPKPLPDPSEANPPRGFTTSRCIALASLALGILWTFLAIKAQLAE